jgi:hypothetical protein
MPIFPLSFHGAAMGKFNFTVFPPVTPVHRGPDTLCWLAATAVLFSWEDNQPVSMQDAANRLGIEFIEKFAASAALLYDDLPLWTSRCGFASEGQQCLAPDGWDRLLRRHGPLIAMTDGSGSVEVDHAVVVFGIGGDGSADGTSLRIANGQNEAIQTYTLNQFATVFELPNGADQLFRVSYKRWLVARGVE